MGKWSYFTLLIRGITPFITDRGPPCMVYLYTYDYDGCFIFFPRHFLHFFSFLSFFSSSNYFVLESSSYIIFGGNPMGKEDFGTRSPRAL